MRSVSCLLVVAIASGCGLVPKAYPRLDEAREAHRQASADPRVIQHALAELKVAGEALERAEAARNALDDPAVVDHLAYLAKQRSVISIEAARVKALQLEALDAARFRVVAVKSPP